MAPAHTPSTVPPSTEAATAPSSVTPIAGRVNGHVIEEAELIEVSLIFGDNRPAWFGTHARAL